MDQYKTDLLFRHYPILETLDRELLAKTLPHIRVMQLKAGTRIFNELDPCQAFPFILSGVVRVYKPSPGGRELTLYTVGPGDACVVTAACLLGNEDYRAAGVAKKDSSLVMMPASDFERLMGSKRFRQFIFSLFSRRVLRLMQLVEEVAFQKLDRRLAALLLKKGNPIPMSHQELADELGTVRETVSRLLKSFSDNGLISLGRERVHILDAPGLQQVVDDFDPV